MPLLKAIEQAITMPGVIAAMIYLGNDGGTVGRAEREAIRDLPDALETKHRCHMCGIEVSPGEEFCSSGCAIDCTRTTSM